MKKILSILLAGAMLAGCVLTGCSDSFRKLFLRFKR